MAGSRTVKIQILGDASNAQKVLKSLGDTAEGFGARLGKIASGAASVAAGMGAFAVGERVLGGAKNALFGLNSEFESIEAQLKAFTKDGDAARAIMEDVRKEAAATPFAVKELGAAYAGLMPAAKQAGMATMDLVKQAEILAAANPAEGLEGAAFALREAVSGDFTSIIERFNLPRQMINDLKAQGLPNLEIVQRAMKEMGYDMDLVSNLAETGAGRWATLQDTFDSIKVTVTRPLFDALVKQLGNVQTWFDANEATIQRWAERIGQFIVRGVSTAIDWIGRIGGVLVNVGRYFQAVVQDGDTLNDWLSHVPASVRPLVQQIGELAAVFVEDALPKLRQFAGWFRDEGLSAIIDFVTTVQGYYRGILLEAVTFFVDQALPRLQQFAGWFRDEALPAISEFAGQAQTFITEQLIPAVAAFVDAAIPRLQQFAAWFRDDALPAMRQFGEFLLNEVVPRVVEFGTQVVGWVQERLIPAVTDFVNATLPILRQFADWFIAEALPKIQEFVTNLLASWDEIKAQLFPTLDAILSYVRTVFDFVRDVITEHGDTIMAVLSRAWEFIETTIDNALTIVKNIILLAMDIIQGDWDSAWNRIKAILSAIWDQIKEVVSLAGDALRVILDLAWDGIKLAAGAAWEGIKGLVSDTWDAIQKKIDDGKDALKDALMWPFEQLRDNVGSIMRAAGNFLLQPLGDAISAFGSFVRGVQGAVNWIGGKLGLGDVISGSWSPPNIPQLARGGRVIAPGLAIVGEHGPELVQLGAGARVVPNAPTEALLMGMDFGRGNQPLGRGGPLDFAKSVAGTVKDVAGEAVATVAEWAGKGGAWVVDQAFSRFNVGLDLPTVFERVGAAVAEKVKDAAVEFVSGLLSALKEKIPAAAAAELTGGWFRPTTGTITQEYGPPNWAAAYSFHTGMDIANRRGTPIHAAAAGDVTGAGVMGGYGNAIILRHTQRLETLYGHLERILVAIGQRVTGGQQIGTMDSTGYSTGDHLHFEVRDGGAAVNPRSVVPGLAEGGIVSVPTLAVIGEAGPEAVVPLGDSSFGRQIDKWAAQAAAQAVTEAVEPLTEATSSLGRMIDKWAQQAAAGAVPSGFGSIGAWGQAWADRARQQAGGAGKIGEPMETGPTVPAIGEYVEGRGYYTGTGYSNIPPGRASAPIRTAADLRVGGGYSTTGGRGGEAAVILDGEVLGRWVDNRRTAQVKQRAGLIAS